MIKVGIIGGAGYTAGELIRILINHPEVELVFVHSTSNAGNKLSDVHGGLAGETDIEFSDSFDLGSVDVVFLCSGHGKSTEFWQEHECPEGLKIIDLAQDFRDEHDGYVYGLPEINRERIKNCDRLANPGCFATAIQLSLLPAASAGLLSGDVNVTGVTGSTGAGVKPGATTHFSWRNDNLSVYKPFNHQHLLEINRTLHSLSKDWTGKVRFIPVRGDFPRGIFIMASFTPGVEYDMAVKLYKDFYADSPFAVVIDKPVDLKQAVNTNKAVISLTMSDDGVLLVTTAIDNLLKGASGQAVENMNLMFGLDETAGLKLKSSAF